MAGLYDFTLDFTPEAALNSGATGTSLFTALESQLGLKIETEKTPLDVLVIDHAERLPLPRANIRHHVWSDTENQT